MRNSNDFRINSTNEIESVRGNVQYVYFIIGNLFNIKIDVVSLVWDQVLLFEERNFLLLITVGNKTNLAIDYSRLLRLLFLLLVSSFLDLIILHLFYHYIKESLSEVYYFIISKRLINYLRILLINH